jgi:hypothetical protein
MFQKKVVENIKTKIFIFNNLVSKYRAVYEIMWKKMAEPDRPKIKI